MKQLAYDPVDFPCYLDGKGLHRAAKAARDKKFRELKKLGVNCTRWINKNQQHYDTGFVRDVYYINVYTP